MSENWRLGLEQERYQTPNLNLDINDPKCDVQEIWFQFYNYSKNYISPGNGQLIVSEFDVIFWIKMVHYPSSNLYNASDDAYELGWTLLEIWERIGIIKLCPGEIIPPPPGLLHKKYIHIGGQNENNNHETTQKGS